ncbi:pilin [Photobacterium phosphoreum]|uniref:pilin n=1 Tax=Photobacterium phosphoreum TaxID=659 RepID=UPI001E431419|nr:pilin [Photobacterium phosphoreum]MCD9479856.1 prepilin-type N-terminal cleavage/methylation domain-containing protein [Photobacterium phosphoreum]
MKKQQGFTLIELMIVVAVIGVLSAIAIPQYQKYVAKAEAASALATMTGVKTNVEAYIVETGAFPDDSTDGQTAQDLGAPEDADLPLGAISFVKATGHLDFLFKTSGVNKLLQGKTLSLVRHATSGAWICNSKDIEKSLLPKNCSGKTAL